MDDKVITQLMPSTAPTLLLVQEKPQIRRIVRAALESEQWAVVEAETLYEARAEVAIS
jgi:DNA-binding response OmpR family regulator